MNQQNIQELYSLTPSALIELFTLDGSTAGETDVYYTFYDGKAAQGKNLVFGGVTYTAFPIQMTEAEIDGKGTLPRPKLSVANINGFVSILLLANSDLIGAKVTRTRVFARSLDAVNFPNGVNPWGTPDPTAIVSSDIFYVNRKVTETNELVTFELATPIEIDNVQLPRRQMLANSCLFIYRDPETCGYTGAPIADSANKSFTAPISSGGYGFTLTDQGQWSDSATYNQGDYVYIISTLVQTAGSKIFYVCKENGVTGISYKPGTSGKWVADACPRTMRACKMRFASGCLRGGFFPGIASARYVN